MRFLLKFDPLPSAFTAVTHILSSTSSYLTVQPIHLAYKRLSSRNCQLFQLVGWNPPFEPRLSCNEQRRHLQLPWQMRMNEQNVNPRASALQNAVKFRRENKRNGGTKRNTQLDLFHSTFHWTREDHSKEMKVKRHVEVLEIWPLVNFHMDAS